MPLPLLLLLLLSPPLALAAGDAGPPASARSFDPDSALVEALRDIEGETLTLSRAIAMALANGTGPSEAEASLDAAQGGLLRERGAFETELFAEFGASGQQTPSSSPFSRPDVIESDESAGSAGARLLLPFGTRIEASLDARRIDTNSAFAAIDPEYRSGGRLEIRQPLLQGRGAGTSADRDAAERGMESAEAAYRDARLLARAQVEAAYWALYAGERDLAVRRLIVEQAAGLLEQAGMRAQAGLAGPNETATARVFLAQQRLDALDQEERVDGLSDRLATLMGARPVSDARYQPVDDPPAEFQPEPVELLIERGLRENALLESAERAHAAVAARAEGARRNASPTLDLIGSLGGSGLSGTGQTVIFGSDTLRTDTSGGYADALGQALGRDFPSWSLGLEFSFPITLRAERGESRRLAAEARRAGHRREALRRDLEERIRAAHRELANGQRRLELAREGVAASFEQVRIGRIEYENGRMTAFEIVRLGSDLASAQQRLSAALVRTAAAAATLSYLAGSPQSKEIGK